MSFILFNFRSPALPAKCWKFRKWRMAAPEFWLIKTSRDSDVVPGNRDVVLTFWEAGFARHLD